MYKILVVDDEPIAVESTMVMIKRNFSGVCDVTSCRSGKLAIEQAAELHPDIVIMDIEMPGISGLEAIKRIKESSTNIEVLILSAFDYFSYAQEAMSAGVVEYLVKPVKEERFVQVLSKVMQCIESKHREKQNSLDQQERILMSIPVLERTFCSMASARDVSVDELKNTCRLIGYEDIGGGVAIFKTRSGEKSGTGVDAERFCAGVMRSSDIIAGEVLGNKVMLYIFSASFESYNREAKSIAESFIGFLKKRGVDAVCGLGGWYSGVVSAANSYKEAERALAVLLESPEIDESVLHIADAASNDVLMQAIMQSVDMLAQNDIKNGGNIIDKAKNYITEHYAEPLTLDDVAKKSNLSQHYFSRLFKQETGVSFTDFLTGTRIENSKKLLMIDELSIKEIAYMVGFNDPNYFSKAFKKATGNTPGKFKNSGRGE